MPEFNIPAKRRVIKLNVSYTDDSPLQLAAMIFALRDSHVKLYHSLTNTPMEEIETAIDEMYEEYLDNLLAQFHQFHGRN